MSAVLPMLQNGAGGSSSGVLILGVVVAAWLLGLGALLIHIVRSNGPAATANPAGPLPDVIDLDNERVLTDPPSAIATNADFALAGVPDMHAPHHADRGVSPPVAQAHLTPQGVPVVQHPAARSTSTATPASPEPLDGDPSVQTTVVPAATAAPPVWDPARAAWVTSHPEFGWLRLNSDTNRWRPL